MRRVTLLVAVLVALLILFVPTHILWLTWSDAEGSSPDGLLTLNTKDSTRLTAEDPTTLSLQASQVLFPDGSNLRPDAIVQVQSNEWQASVAAAPLVRWLNGPLLLDDGTAELAAEIERLKPGGVGNLDGATVVRIGLGQAADEDELTSITAENPAELAAAVDEQVARVVGGFWPNVWLVPDDPFYALPVAYWAAQSGDVVLFGGDPLPEATRQALEQHGGQAHIFIAGPGISADGLTGYGTVQVLSLSEGTAAVQIAQYQDETTRVGWGINGDHYVATHNFVLANANDPTLAAAGLSLARFGKFGPLLWVERDRIPPATEQYLWQMKPEFFITPAEGPFNHLWVLGGLEQVSWQVQGEADLSQEIGAYRFEEAGLSGMEVVWVVWVVAGLFCGAWLLLHSWRRLPQMDTMMRATWALLGLVMGPLAVWLYRLSYHRVPWMRHEQMTMWHRGPVGQTLAASAMNRGFDGPLMLVISWVVTAVGLPLIILRGPGFWLGNSMMLAIFISYFGALILHWLVMHTAMFMHHEKLSYGQAVRRAFQPAFLSMTAMAIGMMGFMWWIQMINLMMEGMPEDDDIMWWGTTLLSIVVGWLVALPVDDWLVRRERQPGTI